MHDLNPLCTSTKPELVVIFFHGIGYGENDEWKETWTSTTSDGTRVCWPQEWLPADLATKNVHNVRILSLSYDSALLGANEDVTEIGKNLVHSLVSKRYGNLNLSIIRVQRQSLALNPMQYKHLFLDPNLPMMYAYPLFAFDYLECQSLNMKRSSTETIIVDVQDMKAKSSLKQDRGGFFLRKSSRNLFSTSH